MPFTVPRSTNRPSAPCSVCGREVTLLTENLAPRHKDATGRYCDGTGLPARLPSPAMSDVDAVDAAYRYAVVLVLDNRVVAQRGANDRDAAITAGVELALHAYRRYPTQSGRGAPDGPDTIRDMLRQGPYARSGSSHWTVTVCDLRPTAAPLPPPLSADQLWVLEQSVDILHLPAPVRSFCRSRELKTVQELRSRTVAWLCQEGCHFPWLESIRRALSRHGLTLNDE